MRSVPGHVTAPTAGATLSGEATARFVPTAGYTVTRVMFYAGSGGSLSPPWIGANPDGSYSWLFNSTQMTNGANRVRALTDWRDAFGELHSHVAEAPVTVRNAVRFGSLSRDAAFSPNGDGVEDVTTTSVQLVNDDADVTVRVLDANGDPVRTLFSGHEDGYVSVDWDATLEDGTRVLDGEYDIEISATNETGTGLPAVRSVTVDTQPVGAVVTPAPGHVLTGTETFSFSPRPGLNVNSVHFWGACRDWVARCPFGYAGIAGIDGNWATNVDTTILVDDDFTLTATASFQDAYGTYHDWPVSVPARVSNPVRVQWHEQRRLLLPQRRRPGGHLRPPLQPDAARHAGHRDQQRGRAASSSAISTTSTVRPSTTTSRWDGRDDDGAVVPDGVYSWTLTATDDEGGTGTATGRFGVLSTLPGALTSPEAGSTFSGPFDVVYQPVEGFEPEQVSFSSCGGDDCWVGSADEPADGEPWTVDDRRRQPPAGRVAARGLCRLDGPVRRRPHVPHGGGADHDRRSVAGLDRRVPPDQHVVHAAARAVRRQLPGQSRGARDRHDRRHRRHGAADAVRRGGGRGGLVLARVGRTRRRPPGHARPGRL